MKYLRAANDQLVAAHLQWNFARQFYIGDILPGAVVGASLVTPCLDDLLHQLIGTRLAALMQLPVLDSFLLQYPGVPEIILSSATAKIGRSEILGSISAALADRNRATG